MARYNVKFKELNDQAVILQGIGKTLAEYENKLRYVAGSMDTRDSSMVTIFRQLNTLNNKIPGIKKKVTSSGLAAEKIASAYQTAEKSNYYNIENAKGWGPNALISDYTGFASLLLKLGFVDTATLGMRSPNSYSFLQFTNGSAVLDFLKGSWKSWNDPSLKYGTWKDPSAKKIIKQEDKPYSQRAYDPITGQMMFFEAAPSFWKKGATILEGKFSTSIDGTILEYADSLKGDWGEGSVNAKLGNAEMHADLSAGLYVYDRYGNKKLAPGVNAEVGVSATALAVSLKGNLGDDMAGVYGGADFNIGKAEAKATGSAMLFNKDGELDIQIRGKASAEAIAIEAKGRAGVSVFGVDAGVTGSVNFGVGAHAEFGYVDGIVKVDVGASFGLGFSVGFELDVGGAVNTICGGAKSVWNTVTGWF